MCPTAYQDVVCANMFKVKLLNTLNYNDSGGDGDKKLNERTRPNERTNQPTHVIAIPPGGGY